MNIRKTRYYREPKKPSITKSSQLSLSLLELARAHFIEVGLTGGPVATFVSMFDAFITSDSMLTWKGNGPGAGRELRRSYSNIHGRTFARAYLEKCEGVKFLLPIEGKRFCFAPHAVIRLRDGEDGDMPDWIGVNAKRFVVAEAKGTYENRNWEYALWAGKRSLPQCLQRGQGQVARVQIDLNRNRLFDIKFKGWTVASRWATENDKLDPWLVALDSEHGSEPVDSGTFQEIAALVQRQVLIKLISAFGLSYGTSIYTDQQNPRLNNEPFDSRRELWRRLVLSDGRQVCGLSAAYVDGTFFPIQNSEEITVLKTLFPDNRYLWAATILDESLNAAEKGKFPSNHETEISDGFLSRNGLAVADLRKVREVRNIQNDVR